MGSGRGDASKPLPPLTLSPCHPVTWSRTLPGVKTTDKSWSDYRISCTKEIDLDINQVAESLANYRNTLAHKTCHSFTPNCYFQQLWHPYHGLVMSIVAGRALAAGEEVFVSYNYALEGAPTWYQALWFEHLRGEEGLTEAEVQDWVLRYQRRTGFCVEVPPPPRDSPRWAGQSRVGVGDKV